MDAQRTPRRGALRRFAVVAAGLVGLGATGAGVAEAASSRPTPPEEPMRLYGRGWQIHSNTARRAVRPGQDDRLSSYGELFGREGGDKIGEFYGNVVTLASPFPGAFDAGTLEFHSFVLEGGSLFGIGNVLQNGEATDVFAIVGGTGRFSGVRGTYVALQNHYGLGGDGSAEFTFNLAT